MDGINRQSIVIRNAELHELDEAAKATLSSYEEYAPLMSDDSWDTYSDNILNVQSRLKESDLIIAIEDGVIVGSTTFYPKDSDRVDSPWPSGWTGLRLVAVTPENRRHGIGKMLVNECVRRSREQSAVAVGLHTTPLMFVAAAMYESMGFIRVPSFDFHPSPDFTVMAYKLAL